MQRKINNYMDEENTNDKINSERVERLLKKMANVPLSDVQKKRGRNANNLVAHVEEYLGPFMVFGYDLSGNAIALSTAKNQKDMDALTVCIGRYMAQNTAGGAYGDVSDFEGE